MQSPAPVGVHRVDALAADAAARVRQLAAAVQAETGQPPLSDQALTLLGSTSVEHLLCESGDRLVGYAQRDGSVAEVVAAADEPLRALLEALQSDAAPDGLTVWSHGWRSRLEPALSALGFTATRTLHQMRMPLAGADISVPPVPDGVSLRTFVVGKDEDAWVRVNAAAFASHPEQGGWTRADVEAREAEDWFDPEGLFLAERGGGTAREVIGFHWTKRHPDGAGEVYVIGIDPSAQGLGLGKLLLTTGLRYLQRIGCPTVLLYVDDSNDTARQLYRRQGFTDYDRDIQWHRG